MNYIIDTFKNMLGLNFLKKSILYFGGDEEEPTAPAFTLPEWARGLPPETLELIRGQVGAQVAEPAEYGISSQALQQMLGYQPEQFQFPMEEIQQAMAAQQALQMEQYQKQIRPTLAGMGQLDSTYYANLLSDFMKGQQAQTYGTTADLLTQQAQQNLQTQQWLPQFQAGVAGQLGGLGGQRAGLEQFNLQLPFQTTIPALQQMYGTGLQQAGQEFQAALVPYQQQLQSYQQQQQQQAALMQGLGSLSLMAATGGMSGAMGLIPGVTGFGGGAMMGLGQGLGMGSPMGMYQQYGYSPQIPTSTIAQTGRGQPTSGQFPASWRY